MGHLLITYYVLVSAIQEESPTLLWAHVPPPHFFPEDSLTIVQSEVWIQQYRAPAVGLPIWEASWLQIRAGTRDCLPFGLVPSLVLGKKKPDLGSELQKGPP